jgi:hypothetical protein
MMAAASGRRTPLSTSGDGTAFGGASTGSVTRTSTATTVPATVVAAGGSGSYLYSWSFISGTNAAITASTGPTTQFIRTQTDGTYVGTFRCTVTDSIYGDSVTHSVVVTTVHEYDPP